MFIKKSLQLSFDDVWLEPQYSEVGSRSDPDLSSSLSKNCVLSHPIIATNMASVVGEKMAKTFDDSGSIAIHHRFLTKEQIINLAKSFSGKLFSYSIGIKNEDLDIAKEVYQILGNKAIPLVDIAHGHTKRMGEMVSNVNKIGYNTIIAGNVATFSGFSFLADYGAHAIRVGIAGGKVCTTKYVTGHHIPTLQSVIECAGGRLHSSNYDHISIIADGGIRYTGDIVKALAAGASTVMIGSLFAGTEESPGETIIFEGRKFKSYRGMGSLEAMQGGSKDRYFQDAEDDIKKLVPEGIVGRVPFKGTVNEVMVQIIGGLRAGMGYCGAKTIRDLQKAKFVRLTNAGLRESHVHDVVITKEAPNYSR